MAADPVAVALNRVADALFTQAKTQRLQLKVAERMCALQEQNLATTKALEEALTGGVKQP
jgi:hypothetical protein